MTSVFNSFPDYGVPAGGRRLYKSSRFEALDSDSEDDIRSQATDDDIRSQATDMIARARESLNYKEILDLMNDTPIDSEWGVSDEEEPLIDIRLDEIMMEIWGAEGLVEVMPSFYVTSSLSDLMFEALMEWLCQNGWEIADQSRDLIRIFHIDHKEPRSWSWAEIEEEPKTLPQTQTQPTPTAEKAEPRDACRRCGAHHWASKTPCATAKNLSKPGTDVGQRDGGPPIPRFCKLGRTCPKPGCRYVHGDTIPRINMPCRFGDSCCGEKKASCLHMHAGETYVKGMVLTRGT